MGRARNFYAWKSHLGEKKRTLHRHAIAGIVQPVHNLLDLQDWWGNRLQVGRRITYLHISMPPDFQTG